MRPEPDALAVCEPLRKIFPPALLGRLVVVPYYPPGDEILGDIVRLHLDRIVRHIGENHKVPLTYDDAVVKPVVSRCTEVERGGRMIDAILTNTILPRISEEYLTRMVEGRPLRAISVDVKDGDFSLEFARGNSTPARSMGETERHGGTTWRTRSRWSAGCTRGG